MLLFLCWFLLGVIGLLFIDYSIFITLNKSYSLKKYFRNYKEELTYGDLFQTIILSIIFGGFLLMGGICMFIFERVIKFLSFNFDERVFKK